MRGKGTNTVIVAIFTLIAIFTSGYLIRLYLQNTCNQLISSLDTIDKYVDEYSWENAYTEIKKMNEEWDSKEKIWGMIINQHEIDNISISLKSALVYINKKDEIDSLSSLSSLRHYIGHIPVMEKISLKNIF